MSLLINTKTYTADSFGTNAIGYVGPAKTFTIRDDLSLRRASPKPTTNSDGKSRAFVKLTRTHALTGVKETSSDSVTNVDIALPVGMASADVDAICDDLGAYISSASFKEQVKKQKVSF